MSNSSITSIKQTNQYPVEDILVVPRAILFNDISPFNGLSTDKTIIDLAIKAIEQHHTFYHRVIAESNPEYKQIIPYILFTHKDSVFLMKRGEKGNEKKLRNKYTLGIGGHIRKEDIHDADIIAWGKREFFEEVEYTGNYTVSLIGLINDDTNLVGQVHAGLAILFEADSPNINIKDELEWGELVPVNELVNWYEQLEPWSKILCDHFLLKK